MKRYLFLFFLLPAFLFYSCSQSGKVETQKPEEKPGQSGPPAQTKKAGFYLGSPAFKDGEEIPVKYCMRQVPGGQNISPPLEWEEPPAGTKSLALICIDTHPVANGWIHWAVVNIPPDVRKLEEGASGNPDLIKGVELVNSFGFEGWGGPMPPEGSGVHTYEFYLLAMPVEEVSVPTTVRVTKEFLEKLRFESIGEGLLTGTYKR